MCTAQGCAAARAPSALSPAHFLPPNRFLSERPPLADEVTLGWGLLSSLPAMRLRTGAGQGRGVRSGKNLHGKLCLTVIPQLFLGGCAQPRKRACRPAHAQRASGAAALKRTSGWLAQASPRRHPLPHVQDPSCEHPSLPPPVPHLPSMLRSKSSDLGEPLIEEERPTAGRTGQEHKRRGPEITRVVGGRAAQVDRRNVQGAGPSRAAWPQARP